MAQQLKPIKVWGAGGPNVPKIHILLEDLGVAYEVVPTALSEVKKPEYVAINPNGRIPAILDPNTGITIWESGAIIEYLIEVYDKEHRLSFAPGTHEYYHAKQWLFLQTTGQGPYYGQLSWFKKFHHEPLPSAVERYAKEVNRLSGVLDAYLAQQEQELGAASISSSNGPWLVGNKLSYADLAFVSWQIIITKVVDKEEYDVDNFPYVKVWLGKLLERESSKTALAAAAQAHAKAT
jgi:glutathione S-transferase